MGGLMSTPAFGRPGKRSNKDPKNPLGRNMEKKPRGPIGFMRPGTQGRMDKTEGRMDKTQGRFQTDPKSARLDALRKAKSRYKEV